MQQIQHGPIPVTQPSVSPDHRGASRTQLSLQAQRIAKRSGQASPWRRWLLRPIFWVVLGLHAALFMLPLPEISKPQVPATDQTQPEQAPVDVKVVSLEDLLQPTPNANRSAPPPRPLEPVPAQSMAVAPTAEQPPPAPEALPPEAKTDPVTPEHTQAFQSKSVSASEDASEAPGEAGLQGFLSALQAQSGQESLATATPQAFANPEFFFDPDPAAALPQLKPGILRTAMIPEQSPDQAYITILISAQDRGFQNTQRSDYGGGVVYEVQQNGQTWYFNLVPAARDQGTIVVVWEQAPTQ